MAQQNKLIIVESPAKARTITKFLGRGYKVEASQGHIRDLPKSQIGVDVDNNFEPKYITIRGRGEILTRIRKEAKAAKAVYPRDRPGSRRRSHILAPGEHPGHRSFHPVPREIPRDHGKGNQVRHQKAGTAGSAPGGRAAGAPRARPAGRL